MRLFRCRRDAAPVLEKLNAEIVRAVSRARSQRDARGGLVPAPQSLDEAARFVPRKRSSGRAP